MAVKPTNKFGRQISNSYLSADGLSSRAHSYTVHTNPYVLNKIKALRKKLTHCNNEHISYQMMPNKNFVMKLSASAYELAKLVVSEHLYSNNFFKDYSVSIKMSVKIKLVQYIVYPTRKKVAHREFILSSLSIFTTPRHQFWLMVTG